MDRDEQEDKTIYKVVMNHEEQYSIWPADRENALGWHDGLGVPVPRNVSIHACGRS